MFGGLSVSNVFDVSPDGQRFLFNLPLHHPTSPVTLIVNWPQLAATLR
jgi:hypothetical protein